MSARDISDELTDLELRMLKAIDIGWEHWEETGGPLPTALVSLMKVAHGALMQRAAKMGKDETLEWGPPEVALLRLEKIRQALMIKISQKQRMLPSNTLE